MKRRLAAYGLALLTTFGTTFGGQDVKAEGFGLFGNRGAGGLFQDIFGGRRGNGVSRWCYEYKRIIMTRDDLASIRGTTRAVRDRIQYNDLIYLCRCEGFRSPWCNGVMRLY